MHFPKDRTARTFDGPVVDHWSHYIHIHYIYIIYDYTHAYIHRYIYRRIIHTSMCTQVYIDTKQTYISRKRPPDQDTLLLHLFLYEIYFGIAFPTFKKNTLTKEFKAKPYMRVQLKDQERIVSLFSVKGFLQFSLSSHIPTCTWTGMLHFFMYAYIYALYTYIYA